MRYEEPISELEWDLYNKNWHGIIWYEDEMRRGNDEKLGGLNDKDDKDEIDSVGTKNTSSSKFEVPHPWSPPLEFDRKKLLELCPLGYKVLNYKKVRIELFGKYKQPDGLVKRYT